VFFNDLLDLFLGILGTGKEVLLHIGYIGQAFRIFCHFWYPDKCTDVLAAVAHKYPNARGLPNNNTLGHLGSFLHHGASSFGKPAPCCTGGCAGLHHRIRDVLGVMKGPTNVDPGS
jgi:hypothetical protein